MNRQFNHALPDIVNAITHNYIQSELLLGKSEKMLPSRDIIIDILNDLKQLIFPGYFSTSLVDVNNAKYYTGQMLAGLHYKMKKQKIGRAHV